MHFRDAPMLFGAACIRLNRVRKAINNDHYIAN